MDRAKLVEAYFGAWNAHEADAIVATFAPSGTYSDPTTPGPLEGAAIGDNAAALWAAFPDVRFEVTSHLSDETGLFSAQWTMTGSNSGSFAGLPPTGRSVVLRGADFIRVGAAGIERVEGYFSPGAIPHQLGIALSPVSRGSSRLALKTCNEHGGAVLLRRLIAQRRVRHDGVVIGEPGGELLEHRVRG